MSKDLFYSMDDDDSEPKKAKGTKKMCAKEMLKFNDYKNCLMNNKPTLKSQQRFKSEAHNVCTEEVDKIALSSNDDKRLQTYDRITIHPYGVSSGNKVIKQSKYKMINFDNYTNENKTELVI